MLYSHSHRLLLALLYSAGFRVQGSGFRVQGSGFRIQGSGRRVQAVRVRVDAHGSFHPEPGCLGGAARLVEMAAEVHAVRSVLWGLMRKSSSKVVSGNPEPFFGTCC